MKAESPLRVRETADCIKQGFGFGNALAEERLAQSRTADGSPEQLETSGIVQENRSGARSDEFGLLQADFQANVLRREEAAHSRSQTCKKEDRWRASAIAVPCECHERRDRERRKPMCWHCCC